MIRFRLSVFGVLAAASFCNCKPQHASDAKKDTDTEVVSATVTETAPIKKDSAFSVVSINRTRKTIYRGLKNPMTIVVPNAVSVKVEGNGLTKVGNYGQYNLRPGTSATAEIKITATMRDGSTFTDTKAFIVKNLPSPKSYLSGITSNSATALVLTEEQIRQAEVEVMMVDFDYDLELAVTGFDILFPSGKKLKVVGNKLNDQATELLKKVRHNGVIKIQNISANASEQNAALFKPEPITVILSKPNKKARPIQKTR